MIEHRNQPRIEKRGQRAARTAEFRGEFMTAGDRQARYLPDPVTHSLFMCRIAHGEIACDGEGGHFGRKRGQSRIQRRHIERCFASVYVVATFQIEHRIAAKRVGKSVPLQVIRAEADHDER